MGVDQDVTVAKVWASMWLIQSLSGCLRRRLQGLIYETGGPGMPSSAPLKVEEFHACRGQLLCSYISLGGPFTFPGGGFLVSTSEADALGLTE